MKKFFVLAIAAMMSFGVSAQQIRTNYRNNGITHISTDYELLQVGNIPSWTKLEFVGFPDGSKLYLLYMNMEQKEAVVAPKGVKMAVTLKNGKFVRLEQVGKSSATPRRLDNGFFRNRLKYAIEPKDMEKILKGVTSIDIVTGWDPDDYIQASFKDDEFSAFLDRHSKAILEASAKTVDLKASLAAYDENAGSIMISPNPIVGKGAHFVYNVILSNIFYKNTEGEDFDLAFVVGTNAKYNIPYDATVRFTLRDGSVISLVNAREDVNFVYVYPSTEEVFRMASVGIASLSVEADGTPILADSFPAGPEDFSSALNQQIQVLMSASPR